MNAPKVLGESQLKFLLPGVQTAEQRLRARANALGIFYKIADYGGSRTPEITARLIQWRDDSVAAGKPYYRVSPFSVGKHGVDGAFDVKVITWPAGMTREEAYEKLGALATPDSLGLMWGGKFGYPRDVYHFESQQSREQLAVRSATWRADKESPWQAGFFDQISTAVVNATAATKKGQATFAVMGALVIIALLVILFYIR